MAPLSTLSRSLSLSLSSSAFPFPFASFLSLIRSTSSSNPPRLYRFLFFYYLFVYTVLRVKLYRSFAISRVAREWPLSTRHFDYCCTVHREQESSRCIKCTRRESTKCLSRTLMYIASVYYIPARCITECLLSLGHRL